MARVTSLRLQYETSGWSLGLTPAQVSLYLVYMLQSVSAAVEWTFSSMSGILELTSVQYLRGEVRK
jgi:hypothetical protein